MEIAQYYEMYNTEEHHWWFRARRKIIHETLKLFCTNKKERALDIGCGTGFNAAILENFASEVSGLDFSDTALELARKLSPRIILIKGDFLEFKPAQKYNIITLLDVLEHIEDDAAALRRIEDILEPGGVALITVPAFSFLWTEHDNLLHHKRRYTKKELINLIRSGTNLDIKKISYFNTLMFAPILAFRFVRKIFNLGEGESDFFMPQKPINYAFEKIFSLEAPALRWINFPFGVSIICALKKRTHQ